MPARDTNGSPPGRVPVPSFTAGPGAAGTPWEWAMTSTRPSGESVAARSMASSTTAAAWGQRMVNESYVTAWHVPAGPPGTARGRLGAASQIHGLGRPGHARARPGAERPSRCGAAESGLLHAGHVLDRSRGVGRRLAHVLDGGTTPRRQRSNSSTEAVKPWTKLRPPIGPISPAQNMPATARGPTRRR